MVLRQTIKGPVSYSDYTSLIKSCLRLYSHGTANYIAARLKYFRENVTEKKNFKITIFEDNRKLVVFKVKGGKGSIFTSKYRISDRSIARYDWRHSFWKIVCNVVIGASYIAEAICYFVPGGHVATPVIKTIRKVTKIGKFLVQNRPGLAALEYVKPDLDLF